MKKNRRKFIRNSGLMLAGSLIINPGFPEAGDINNPSSQIMTVTGPLDINNDHIILAHEHILSRFGVAPEEPAEYDHEKVLKTVGPYLKYLKSLGCATICCCTTAYFGRNVKVLKELSEFSGVNIITNTGYYGAAEDRYVPEMVYHNGPERIASDWISEWKNGIGDTDIKPGFVKTAVDAGPLSEVDKKLVEAAALTHLETGLTLQVHTSDNVNAAQKQLEILAENGVSPEAWVWVHAQNVNNVDHLKKAADKGAWISLDHLFTPYYFNNKKQGENTLNIHFNHLKELKEAGYLSQVLISHDGSTYPPEGVAFRPMDILVNSFIPMLKAGGFSEREIKQLTVTNPGEAFKIRKRLI